MTTQTKTTHTPGPWHCGYEDLGGETLCYKVYGNDNQRIATFGRWNGVGDEANANLVASAPELLEAIKRVRHAFYVDGTSKALRIAFEGTKEIVAKAEGRGE